MRPGARILRIEILLPVSLACLLAALPIAWAGERPPHGMVTGVELDEASAYALSQDAVGRQVRDHSFVNRAGQSVSLADFRGTPLVVSLIYTSCYHTCSVATQHLANVVDIAREALGSGSFTVLTIGFDTAADTPERMTSYAREQSISIPDWQFLSVDEETLPGLTADLGFVYFPSPKGFEHTVQVTLLDAEGGVYRQIYGEQFPTPSLVEPLKDLVFGTRAQAATLSGWVNGLKLFCTVYDPAIGRYRFDYSVFVGALVGVICLGAVAAFLVQAWRQGSGRRHVG